MLSNVHLRLSAAEDLAEGYAWYEQEAQLGDDFLAAVEQALESISRHPRSHAIAVKNVRRVLMRRFPYSIFYEEMPDGIVVRAIFHNARKPSRWRHRLREEK